MAEAYELLNRLLKHVEEYIRVPRDDHRGLTQNKDKQDHHLHKTDANLIERTPP